MISCGKNNANTENNRHTFAKNTYTHKENIAADDVNRIFDAAHRCQENYDDAFEFH